MYLDHWGLESIWRGLGNGKTGTSGIGKPANWRTKGPNFGLILTTSSTRPRGANRIQIGTRRIFGGSRNQQPWRFKEGSIYCWVNGRILVRG